MLEVIIAGLVLSTVTYYIGMYRGANMNKEGKSMSFKEVLDKYCEDEA